MTLEQAVEILNRERHRGRDDWRVVQRRTPGMFTLCPILAAAPGDAPVVGPADFHLMEFEAVAIAEKYEGTRTSMIVGGTINISGDFRM